MRAFGLAGSLWAQGCGGASTPRRRRCGGRGPVCGRRAGRPTLRDLGPRRPVRAAGAARSVPQRHESRGPTSGPARGGRRGRTGPRRARLHMRPPADWAISTRPSPPLLLPGPLHHPADGRDVRVVGLEPRRLVGCGARLAEAAEGGKGHGPPAGRAAQVGLCGWRAGRRPLPPRPHRLSEMAAAAAAAGDGDKANPADTGEGCR